MKQMRAFKVRIYPNSSQEKLILQNIGCSRFIYNNMLAERIQVYEKLKGTDELKNYEYRTEKSYKNEFQWLKDADSQALLQSRMDLQAAYNNFYRKCKNGTKEKIFPKFHKKGRKDSYRTPLTNNNIQIDFGNKKIKLPKITPIHYHDDRKLENIQIRNATVSRTSTGKYFVSILYIKEVQEPKSIDTKAKGLKIKGLDMSLQNFFVDENGNSPAYEKLYRKFEPKISRWNMIVSRRKKGSNRREKAQLRLNRLHEKVSNPRKDFIEKLSKQLVSENDIIVVESLNMKNMAQTLRFGKSVNDLGWGSFINRLKVKATETGKLVIETNKWFASSKTCNFCGFVKKDLELVGSEWDCPVCNTHHHRDTNAAINLVKYGINTLREPQEVLSEISCQMQKKKQLFIW